MFKSASLTALALTAPDPSMAITRIESLELGVFRESPKLTNPGFGDGGSIPVPRPSGEYFLCTTDLPPMAIIVSLNPKFNKIHKNSPKKIGGKIVNEKMMNFENSNEKE